MPQDRACLSTLLCIYGKFSVSSIPSIILVWFRKSFHHSITHLNTLHALVLWIILSWIQMNKSSKKLLFLWCIVSTLWLIIRTEETKNNWYNNWKISLHKSVARFTASSKFQMGISVNYHTQWLIIYNELWPFACYTAFKLSFCKTESRFHFIVQEFVGLQIKSEIGHLLQDCLKQLSYF